MQKYNFAEYNINPAQFYIGQNYPNPFDKKTNIKYCIPFKTNVVLRILNSREEEVAILVNEEKNAGTYQVEFDSHLYTLNEKFTEIIYFCRLEAGDYSKEKIMRRRIQLR